MSFTLDVEICQKPESALSRDEIGNMVQNMILRTPEIHINKIYNDRSYWWNHLMIRHIYSITCSCDNIEKETVYMKDCSGVRTFVYRLTGEEAGTETMQCDSEELPVASHWILPCREFEGLWENLCYPPSVKENLYNFVETSIMFSDKKVNPNIISWNKVVLLHGPPGTGKTSLCKALAQKATIRLSKKFNRGELIEINSHSLFSKWFSESGKLVMKLFSEIKRLLEDPQAFICILIDEVESLAHARKSSMNGTEPSDSIRVVNALLTQLDQIKSYKNVLILTTSNITEAIDLAFVDRADIKQYIGNPIENSIRLIYLTCLRELMRVAVIKSIDDQELREQLNSNSLISLSCGLSGRALRKIPFLTQALHMKTNSECDLKDFIDAMKKVVIYYKENELDGK
ncbi:hypothetical protein PV328_008899 [Microctonus aethiopoides]|uniref:AAA+ ATPase domain-containing protein n=1 Tax=Microctonus aethiopoides TaxID=144406 RepID=A0AA39FK88_9HYME|nr:hypothetical protein PV328_008899 [Microctonus aethiopoides]